MTSAALAFAGLARRFGPLRVLVDTSGEVAAGGVLAVRGPNGCGKSTLLRCLAGLLRPDRGTIAAREAGRTLDDAERRTRVGYVAPDLAFYDELTGSENLALFARLRGVDRGRGESLLARLGLAAERPFHAMSSGMRQRLRWAFALLHEPSILLLDEPFQNFDAAGERAARELLDERLAAGALAVVASPAEVDLPRVTGELELGG
jgi:ABC-type multidrug transport system ATPase subunit